MRSPVWLVTGGTGQVGGALSAARPRGVRIIAPSRQELDLSNPAMDPMPLIQRHGVSAVINCGAFTQVDRAEIEEALALQVNGYAAGVLARAAAAASIPMIQISTDYVFSGEKPDPYCEDDETDPRTAYGRSKLEGERQVATSGARHAIVRTAWVFGATGQNFVRTMLRLGSERDRLAVVDDQQGCPTHAGDLAQALATIATAFERGECGSGRWHCANAGETTWHGFAQHVFARAAGYGGKVPLVEAIATADYPTPAQRPANSRLATGKINRDFGIELRPWQAASDETVDVILQERQGAAA